MTRRALVSALAAATSAAGAVSALATAAPPQTVAPRAATTATAPARFALPVAAPAHASAAAPSPLAAADPGAAPTPTASPSPPSASDPDAGLSWTPPPGWRPVLSRLTSLAQPMHRLAAATFALRQGKPDRDCGPDSARAQLPAGGALVYLLEDREAEARPRGLDQYPARPAHFRVGRARTYECLGLGAIAWWTEQGRAFQAQMLLGPRASAARRRQVEALLDSLVVRAIPPPAPPIGWRSVVSGAYDSVRVPPGWSAHALERVHSTPRPRTLFRVANPANTVVVRITELRRDHGRRFRTRVFTRPGATAQDVESANVAARSFGFAQS